MINIEKLIKSKKLSILAYILCLILSIFAINNKNGFHVDEYYTYGLANSVKEDKYFPIEDNIECDPEEVFLNYLAVPEGGSFNFKNVWQKQASDVHPPFYYVLIHILCSIFPHTYSRWYAGFINIIFSLLTLFFIRKTIALLSDDIIDKNLISILYASTTLVLSAMTFLRMYIMLMFEITLLTYLFIKYDDDKIKNEFYFKLFFVTYLGAMTHYYFLIYLFFISFYFVIRKLIKKNFVDTLKYIFTMIISVLISILTFKDILKHVFKSHRFDQSYENLLNINDYLERLKYYIELIDKQLLGGLFIFSIITILIIWFMKKVINKKLMSKHSYILIPSLFYFLIVAKIAVYCVDRYMIPIYAILLISIPLLSFYLINELIKNYKLIIKISLIISMIIGSLLYTNWTYKYPKYKAIINDSLKYQDKKCVMIYGNPNDIVYTYEEVRNYKAIYFMHKDNVNYDILKELINEGFILSTISMSDFKAFARKVVKNIDENASHQLIGDESIWEKAKNKSYYVSIGK